MNTTDLFQLRLDHVVSVEHARNDSDDERADSHEFLRPPCRSCSQNSSQRATASKVRVPARPRPRLNRPPPGLAFHPTQPLLAAALHNGSVQLWNYRMGVLVDRFEEHEGTLFRPRHCPS